MKTMVRACLYGLAGVVVLGLVGCSDPLSNGYGGWYWQMPETSIPAATANASTSGATHAKAATNSASGSSQG